MNELLIKTETHNNNTYTEYWNFISDEIITDGEKRTFTENSKRIFLEQYSDKNFAECYQIIQYGYED